MQVTCVVLAHSKEQQTHWCSCLAALANNPRLSSLGSDPMPWSSKAKVAFRFESGEKKKSSQDYQRRGSASRRFTACRAR
eukprot:1651245-Amphidinium_carterae.1